MKIEKFSLGILGANCFLLIDEDTKATVVVDPGGYSKKFQAYIEEEKLDIKAILLTHGHFDHIMGIDSILETKQVPVYVHEEDLPIMTEPKLNLSSSYTKGYTFADALPMKDGQVFNFLGEPIEVIHTPGHTMGGCCFYIPAAQAVLSGDTLFQRSVGRTDFPNSSPDGIICSIKERLFTLPDETIVYPGHSGETKIGFEKENNPYVV